LGSAVVGEFLPRKARRQVIVGTRDGKVRLLDVETGAAFLGIRRRLSLGRGSHRRKPPLFRHRQRPNPSALTSNAGPGIWRASLDPSRFFICPCPQLRPYQASRSIIIGSSSGTLYSLNAVTGKKNWEYKATGAIVCAPRISDGRAGVRSLGRLPVLQWTWRAGWASGPTGLAGRCTTRRTCHPRSMTAKSS
jgi:outer membrane protein assembly factor BamB